MLPAIQIWLLNVEGGGNDMAGVLVATVSLTANQINHLFSSPQTIIPAPGLGKAILVLNAQLVCTVGSIPFDSESAGANVYYGSAAGPNFVLEIDNVTVSSAIQGKLPSPLNYTAINNIPIVAAGTFEDMVHGGAVATATVGAGGLGYAPGDTGTLNPQTTATYVVDTVGAGGAITAFHFSNAGYGNNVGNGKSTNVLTGAGDGNFTINVTGITPGNGTDLITIAYQVVTLP